MNYDDFYGIKSDQYYWIIKQYSITVYSIYRMVSREETYTTREIHVNKSSYRYRYIEHYDSAESNQNILNYTLPWIDRNINDVLLKIKLLEFYRAFFRKKKKNKVQIRNLIGFLVESMR